ncbi:MAG: hypothetical protein ACK4TR_16080, partial [Phenylobacterium sp.]
MAKGTSRTSLKSAWMANQTARFRMTPTTAAVIAVSADESAALPLVCLIGGKLWCLPGRPPGVGAPDGLSVEGPQTPEPFGLG